MSTNVLLRCSGYGARSRIVARAVAAEVTRRKCFSHQNPPPYVGGGQAVEEEVGLIGRIRSSVLRILTTRPRREWNSLTSHFKPVGSQKTHSPVYRNPNERMTFKTLHFSHFSVLALAAALVLAGSPARGGNLLVNPGFEANSGHLVATGWTYFSPPPPPGYFGDYWVESSVPAHSGTLYWKEWGALYLPAPTNN